ncbi:MAG TPA: M48 family metalloprotease [Acidimicrobiales bacterium]|nr:M48 family metalloprotease [Acidimicrobiales bacterium]
MRRDNRRRAWTVCLVPSLVVAVVVGGILVGAGSALVGLVVFVALSVVGPIALWSASPGLVVRSLGARRCSAGEHERLLNLVDGLCATLGLPPPAVAVVDSTTPNALTVGRSPDDAVLVVTSGLASGLSLVQLEGVLAHELVHVKRHDMVVSGPAATAAALCSVAVGTGRASELVHRIVGPGREFAADQRAALVVRYPPGLEGALETMAGARSGEWPPARGRLVAVSRWLWIDPRPTTRSPSGAAPVGDGGLDDTAVRAAALALR